MSFCRFMRTLGNLGVQGSVGSNINDSRRQTLRILVIYHVTRNILRLESQFPGLKEQIQNLPIWPGFTTASTLPLICARGAYIADNSSMLVSWIPQSGFFIDPKFLIDVGYPNSALCLGRLGVCKISADALLQLHILPLPQDVGKACLEEYNALVDTLAKTPLASYDTLKTNLFAIDGNIKLRLVSQLFDHDNPIFKAAFVLENSTRFVHLDLRIHREFWLRCGLRTDVLNMVVLEPLTELNHRLNRFSPTVWATIGDVKVFQSRTVFNDEYGHQREIMAAVAKEKPMQSLSEIISRAYIPICWSQVPFAIHEPSSHVFNQMSKKLKPHVSLVWKHLQTLKFISLQLKPYHVKDYLGDLRKTYQHLQDHLEESTGTFILNDNEVWLNMSEWNHLTVLMEDLRSSWQSLDKLVLSSSVDSGPLRLSDRA
ncbi:uncharacterized protein RAG0_10592 [Rhynchosporium agropyri]|uniref:Uncharacterized protein n=1 Tax=Rhynchosporium agropyri TaxID=914238 RepID=A0A1E1L0G4_9HELO|nr:uncharacterized protein RAG0_10592 [Rhynchosporium agropyri]